MVAAFSKSSLANLPHRDHLGLKCFSPSTELTNQHPTSSEITAESHIKGFYFEHFPLNCIKSYH